jgi:hypothetical protein
MKYVRYVAFLGALAVLSPLGAFARDKNQRSVDIPDAVQVGGTQLEAGHYRLEIQGTGSDVQVSFLRDGKTVATVPCKLKTNDQQAGEDAVVMDMANKTLDEIHFGRDKESLVFEQSGM